MQQEAFDLVMSNLNAMVFHQGEHDKIVDQAADLQKKELEIAILKHFKKSDQKHF
jgi:hypothetical protein